MDADDFDDWKKWDRFFPLDDQSNFHIPQAAINAAIFNVNRGSDTPAVTMEDCLMFRGMKSVDVDIGNAEGW